LLLVKMWTFNQGLREGAKKLVEHLWMLLGVARTCSQ